MAISTGRASPSGRSGNADHFRALFRRRVFSLLYWGYQRLDAAEYQASEETDITGELRDAVQQVLEDRALPPPSWARAFFIREEDPLSSPHRKGKRRKRIDLQFEFSAPHARVRFDIEAKRLSKGNSEVGEYLGPKGLGEFIAGNYASGDLDGGMLGYVQTGTPEEWAVKIEAGMTKRKSELLVLTGGSWRAVELASGLQHCYSSAHQRPTVGKPISIFHSLLDFAN